MIPSWSEHPSVDFSVRFASLLVEWEGTKYWHGQLARGHFADCLTFVCALLDELLEREITPIPPMRQTLYDVEAVLSLFPLVELADDATLRAGDVVLMERAGLPHVLIMGPWKNTAWHCVRGHGVTQTSIKALAPLGVKLQRAFRLVLPE